MSDFSLDTQKFTFTIDEHEKGISIRTEPIKKGELYTTSPRLEIALSKNTPKKMAWELVYLLNEFATSFAFFDLNPNDRIEDSK